MHFLFYSENPSCNCGIPILMWKKVCQRVITDLKKLLTENGIEIPEREAEAEAQEEGEAQTAEKPAHADLSDSFWLIFDTLPKLKNTTHFVF